MAETELSAGTSTDVIGWRAVSSAATASRRALAAETAADERFDLHALIELAERAAHPSSRSGSWPRSRPV